MYNGDENKKFNEKESFWKKVMDLDDEGLVGKDIFIYVDDTGVLHKNSNDNFFVYAGLVFIGKEQKNLIKKRYKRLEDKIKNNNPNLYQDEMKGSNLKNKHKRSLYSVFKNEYTFVVEAKISNIHDNILNDKKSIQRFKDYMIVRIIKKSLIELIESSKITKNDKINLSIFVDEQNTATNGIYNLNESIKEELFIGKHKTGGGFRKPCFKTIGNVNLKYANSKYNILIRASDLLANKKYGYKKKNQDKKLRDNHFYIKLP